MKNIQEILLKNNGKKRHTKYILRQNQVIISCEIDQGLSCLLDSHDNELVLLLKVQ